MGDSTRERYECPHCRNMVWLFEEAPAETECPHCGKILGLPDPLLGFDLRSADENFHLPIENAPRVSLADFVPDQRILQLVPSQVAREHMVFPLSRTKHALKLAVTESMEFETCDRLRFILNCKLEIVIAEGSEIHKLIERNYVQ